MLDVVETDEQRQELQSMLNKLVTGSADWQILFNAGKLNLLHEYTKEGGGGEGPGICSKWWDGGARESQAYSLEVPEEDQWNILQLEAWYVRRVAGEDRDAEFWEQEGEGRHWHSSIVVGLA